MAAFQIATLEQNGFVEIRGLLDPQSVYSALGGLSGGPGDDRRHGGVRNALVAHPSLAAVAIDAGVRHLVRALLDGEPVLTRAILFDKRPEANWDLSWHQDATIAVRTRVETSGFGPWSLKGGVVHVQPPASVLERMITVRVNLDDCDQRNGPLLVLPGTHRAGLLDDQQIRRLVEHRCDDAVACTGGPGDAVAMRPLLLHSSEKAESPRHRRILHLEFAVGELPNGLEWANALA